MEDREKAIRELHEQIQTLAAQQKEVQQQIQKLQNAVFELNIAEIGDLKEAQKKPVEKIEVKEQPTEQPKVVVTPPPVYQTPKQKVEQFVNQQKKAVEKKQRAPLEEFIGANLLNKIGIAVLVIGIAFGTKYSIDHNLIDPLTRIILGYVAGALLIGIALRLKKNHENFSAVLLSGGMAVLYFITYAAYDFYQLIPQAMAFGFMVMFTVFTVFASIQYNKEVISIIGLMGAYAVPFLLSDGSGRVMILFSYITIINAGILFLAFRKEWKILYYLGFVLTWLSFAAWFGTSYNEDQHLWISLGFSTIFFVTFYLTFLSYKLLRKEPFKQLDILITLANSFIFFGFGYSSIELLETGDQYLGLFTLFNAIIHFIAFAVIYKRQDQFKETFYFVAGLVLTFLTLAVPVQLEGHWVTLIWAVEAALLFWIGRTKKFPAYENLSYPLIALAIGSLAHDWSNFYATIDYSWFSSVDYEGYAIDFRLFLNIQFLTTLIVSASLGAILWLSRKVATDNNTEIRHRILSYGLPTALILILYVGFYKEVEMFWIERFADSLVQAKSEYGDTYPQYDTDVLGFKNLWLMYYSAIFAIVLSVVQIRFIKNENLMKVCTVLNALVVAVFVTAGLIEAADLRYSYLNNVYGEYYVRDWSHITVRYVGIVLMIPLMLINYRFIKNSAFTQTIRQTERLLFHTAVLIILSSELVHWLDMSGVQDAYKLALSILWGAYALFLIVLGLWKDYKYIRIAAIALFGITLIKVFIYDMEDMSTIAKTIVMMILGVLLLVASFLYNKYKKSTGNETV